MFLAFSFLMYLLCHLFEVFYFFFGCSVEAGLGRHILFFFSKQELYVGISFIFTPLSFYPSTLIMLDSQSHLKMENEIYYSIRTFFLKAY